MRPTTLLLVALGATTAHASWFGSEPSSSPSPSQWTADQLERAQVAFQNLKSDAFDAWDESKLREFLLEQGVVEPKGTREQLLLLAKQQYRQYNSAASSASSGVGSLAGQASKSATSLASEASRTASTAVYGDSTDQASKSVSSYIAQATAEVGRTLDDSKDYVYSTWDDNKLRKYLEEKGVVKTKEKATRDQLLAKMRETYAQTTTPVWKAWSDSYSRQWLVDHGIVKSNEQKKKDELVGLMNSYYYDTKDTAYSSWTESQMRQWLIDHNVIKSEAQAGREKLQKLLADNYVNAKDTVWSSWKDSDMRDWLIANGYLKSDAKKTREELVDLMHSKYNDYSTRTAAYLTWPDARLRAYLRENNLSEESLPTSRPGLLQEARIRWVQTTDHTESLFNKLKDIIMNGVGAAEEKLGLIIELITGHAETAKERSKAYVGEKAHQAKEKGAEFEKAGKKSWNEKVDQTKRKADEVKVEL
ncbi:hypothetical protein QCA50_008111 [Cerrena zonata]|uniref:Uncharacterized protein n=1 Tax=Cerrena zonata TaxID=2478898 RepID=A0AAW0G5L3_9APHY